MSYIEDKVYKTKTGQPFLLKTALPMDAEGTREFMFQALKDGKYFIQLPHEFTRTKREEKRILKKKLTSLNEIILIAKTKSQIIGLLTVSVSSKKRSQHTAEFGISILKDAKGLGIGKALMSTLIEWAERNSTLERIELRVHSENKIAINLYKKFNFEVEGTRKKAIRYENGVYMDEFIMCLHLPNSSNVKV
ncbi:MAG: GNAT family N-acetyltransferase [Sphingomonadales bacterium]|jgi:RimJ/RimL family protein N-acetyltransferase